MANLIQTCDSCIHEKICKHKEDFTLTCSQVKNAISIDSFFKASVTCPEWDLKPTMFK